MSIGGMVSFGILCFLVVLSFTIADNLLGNNTVASLVLGGYDRSRLKLPPTSFPMTSGINNTLGLAVQSITVDGNGNSVSATLDTNNFAQTFSAAIDSTLPYLWLPLAVCNRLEQIFSLTYDIATDMYLVNSTSRERNINSTISFKFGATQTSSDFVVITLPYSAFDLNASWPIFSSSTNYFPIRRAPGNIFTLGRTLLQEAYLTVNYEYSNFSLAQAVFNDGQSDIVAISNGQSSPSSRLSTAALIGIIVGAVVLLILIAILLFFFFRRRKHRDRLSVKSTSPETSHIPQTGTWTWQQSESSNSYYEANEGPGGNSHSSGSRRDTISPMAFSPMMSANTSTQDAWPLPNNYELPAVEAPRHPSNVSNSTGQSTDDRNRSRESSYQLSGDLEKPLVRQGYLSGLSEMSCDTEIHELESPTESSARKHAERYQNLLVPPREV
jgi:hypothetical protein